MALAFNLVSVRGRPAGFRGGLGDTYGTSLYTIPEYEGTRQHYRLTVAEQTRCESLGVRHVTPWLWLGGGYRRVVVPGRPGGGSGDNKWDYSLSYSWMIGAEKAPFWPFYTRNRTFAKTGSGQTSGKLKHTAVFSQGANSPTLSTQQHRGATRRGITPRWSPCFLTSLASTAGRTRHASTRSVFAPSDG